MIRRRLRFEEFSPARLEVYNAMKDKGVILAWMIPYIADTQGKLTLTQRMT